MPAPRASTGRFVAGLVGLFVCSTMAWLLVWAAAASLWQGSAPVLVASGSMGPSVRAGDLVVLEPYHSQDLTPGTVIRFDDPEGRGSMLHRVVDVEDDGTIRTKGDANAVVDSSAVEAGRITGVGRVLIPRAGLPVLWWRTGEWMALAFFGLVTVTGLFVTRFALLDAYDPWRNGVAEPAPRPPLPVAARDAIDRFRDEVARDGPVLVSRRVVLRRGAELTALAVGMAFLASSRTAWAAYTDVTADTGNHFSALSLTAPTGLSTGPAGCDGAPAIATVGSATTASALNDAATSVTLAVPSGTATGDVLIAHVVAHTHAWPATPLPTPSGWTEVRVDTDLTHITSGVFVRVVTGSEPATYTFDNASGDTTQQMVGAMQAYRGVDTANPIDADAGATDVTGADTLVAPSVTTTRAGARLLSLVGTFGSDQGPATPPAGMTERYERTELSESAIVEVLGEMADETLSTVGASGTRSTSVPTSDSSVAQAVALRPDVGPPSVALSWTPSSAPGVQGYIVERRIGATLDATTTVTPGSASSYVDGPLTPGTTYAYRVIAYRGSWRSAAATTTYTPAAC